VSDTAPDPQYVEARRVLLDALDALSPQADAVILAGAQAIYLRAGPNSLPVSDYTIDGDLTLDPSALLDEPALEELMKEAGFKLAVKQGSKEPGIWTVVAIVADATAKIAVDLIVPEAVAPRRGRRGALDEPHGKLAARKIAGLEAALADNDALDISALDPADSRSTTVRVAGVAALIVAKIHKLSDRVTGNRSDRIKDKDAADVVRLMGAQKASSVAATLTDLSIHPDAGEVTRAAIDGFIQLFGTRAGVGIEMAARSLRTGMPEERVYAICLAYAEQLRQALSPSGPEPSQPNRWR
jgi:hypothetical protein